MIQDHSDASHACRRFVVQRTKWLAYISRYPWPRFIIRFRNVVDKLPVMISATITILLLFFYGIPVDPNTGRPLGEGRFFTRGSPPPGYIAEDYPYAAMTSDPDGLGARSA